MITSWQNSTEHNGHLLINTQKALKIIIYCDQYKL